MRKPTEEEILNMLDRSRLEDTPETRKIVEKVLQIHFMAEMIAGERIPLPTIQKPQFERDLDLMIARSKKALH